jgi:hypothetical protein
MIALSLSPRLSQSFCSVKITGEVRKYAAEHGIAEEEALADGGGEGGGVSGEGKRRLREGVNMKATPPAIFNRRI